MLEYKLAWQRIWLARAVPPLRAIMPPRRRSALAQRRQKPSHEAVDRIQRAPASAATAAKLRLSHCAEQVPATRLQEVKPEAYQ